MNTVKHTTLLDLIQTVSAYARSDAEIVATVASLVNSGTVCLCGTFRRRSHRSDDNTGPAAPADKRVRSRHVKRSARRRVNHD